MERLARDEDGFFLLVETEGTDTEQHGNASIEIIRDDIVEFDRAVAEALDFASRSGETLVVVTADHETGGMALHQSEGRWTLEYTSEGHTGTMVPLFAAGPGAERFAGIHARRRGRTNPARALVGIGAIGRRCAELEGEGGWDVRKRRGS